MANNDKKDTKALAGGAIVLSAAALITALTRKVKAAPPDEIPPVIEVILEDVVKEALAMIISQQANALTKLDTANLTLTAIAEALGAAPPVIEERILEPFKKEAQTLQKGVPFAVYESKPGKGSLIWAIFDVSDPDTKLSFRIDDLVWNFKFSTLLTQGIQQPLFPGAWLSKADAISGHYCIIFSAGDIEGFVYKQRLIISLTFEGVGTATLHEARGIVWTYL
ncbi:hypothetical protein ES703_67264 [subsurface metagenome]